MKTLKLISLFLTLLMLSGCNKEMIDGPYQFYSYDALYLSFQDLAGNDLVNGIENEDYWLQFVMSEGEITPGILKGLDYNEPLGSALKAIYWQPSERIFLNIIDGTYYLLFYLMTPKYSDLYNNHTSFLPAETITLKLKCLYVFGDDAEYEIVSYWKPYEDNPYRQICYRIEAGGKEYAVDHFSTRPDNLPNAASATVILER